MRFALVFLGICHPQIRDGGCFVVLLLLVCGVSVHLSSFTCLLCVVQEALLIIVMWDPQVLQLADSRVGSFSICCKFKALEDTDNDV